MARPFPFDPRPLIAAFGHEDAQLLRLAADSFAASLDAADELEPSPERRRQVARLRFLALALSRANQARDWLEHERTTHPADAAVAEADSTL